MTKRCALIFGMLAVSALMWSPAKADRTFDCSSSAVPDKNATCQNNMVETAGVKPFSCGHTRNQDQAIYCGAVYGYESNWCARIKNPNLRRACFRDTE
ncbi:MAG: hypothetical protein WCF85_20180 [Rhodospirillaceae bacterium]